MKTAIRHKVPHQARARLMVNATMIMNTVVFDQKVARACAAETYVQPLHAESIAK
jgi:hypothetical protein